MNARENDVLQKIDRYIKGELSKDEADRLWEEFLRNPDYLRLLEAEVAARNYFLNEQGEVVRPGVDGGRK
jgi:hypothetical protein